MQTSIIHIIIRLGTNQIDTFQIGIPYFKHDFGFECGVVHPTKTKNCNAAIPAVSFSVPVIHEFSNPVQNQTFEMSKINTRKEYFMSTTGERLKTSIIT